MAKTFNEIQKNNRLRQLIADVHDEVDQCVLKTADVIDVTMSELAKRISVLHQLSLLAYQSIPDNSLMDRPRRRDLGTDGCKQDLWNSIVSMKGSCKVLSKAWHNCLDAHMPMCSLECMVHRPHGISCCIKSAHIGPELFSKRAEKYFGSSEKG